MLRVCCMHGEREGCRCWVGIEERGLRECACTWGRFSMCFCSTRTDCCFFSFTLFFQRGLPRAYGPNGNANGLFASMGFEPDLD